MRSVLLTLALLLPTGAPAQAPAGEKLKFVLILSRHGVRPPTKANDSIAPYAAQPWPAWPVPPGELTPRGADLLKLFAAYDRDWLIARKLLPSAGCPENLVYVSADSDQRTIATGQALTQILPGCHLPVHSLAQGTPDPLYHPLAAGISPPPSAATLAALSERLHGDPALPLAQNAEALRLLAHVLAPDPEHPAETPFSNLHSSLKAGEGDHMVELRGPLATASTLSEDLLLEYAEGKPAQEVGWGRVDEPTLRTLLSLHSAYFDLMHRTPLLARVEASNLLFHIAATLQQAATTRPVPGAIGPPPARIVVLAGHDTNLAGLAALLGLHWALDGRADDTPPGTQLAFELWEAPHTHTLSVRIAARIQTLDQLRNATPLSLQHPPAEQSLSIPGCGTTPSACSLEDFQTLAAKSLDLRYTRP